MSANEKKSLIDANIRRLESLCRNLNVLDNYELIVKEMGSSVMFPMDRMPAKVTLIDKLQDKELQRVNNTSPNCINQIEQMFAKHTGYSKIAIEYTRQVGFSDTSDEDGINFSVDTMAPHEVEGLFQDVINNALRKTFENVDLSSVGPRLFQIIHTDEFEGVRRSDNDDEPIPLKNITPDMLGTVENHGMVDILLSNKLPNGAADMSLYVDMITEALSETSLGLDVVKGRYVSYDNHLPLGDKEVPVLFDIHGITDTFKNSIQPDEMAKNIANSLIMNGFDLPENFVSNISSSIARYDELGFDHEKMASMSMNTVKEHILEHQLDTLNKSVKPQIESPLQPEPEQVSAKRKFG